MKSLERFVQRAEELKTDQNFKNLVLRDTVAFRILEIMEQKNISKSELADGLGTSKANITQMLNGGRNFTLDTLNQIASVLKMELDVDFSYPSVDEKRFTPIGIYSSSGHSSVESDIVEWLPINGGELISRFA